MYRFYVSADQLAEKEVFISGGDVNHIKNVLRLEVGDWIVACDGNGTDYVSRIQSICSDEVVASIEKVQPTGTETAGEDHFISGNAEERQTGTDHSKGGGTGCL